MERSTTENTWDRVLGRIRSSISTRAYRTWFQPTRYVAEDPTVVRIEVPNDWFAEWLQSNFGELIRSALRDIERPDLQIDLCISQFLYSLRSVIHRALSQSYSFAAFDADEYVAHYLDLFSRGIRHTKDER